MTDGTVALESLSEFLAMKLMARSLPHTNGQFLTLLKTIRSENWGHREVAQMGLSESGCTTFTCRAGMCKQNNISNISGREQDRLTVHLWFAVSCVCVCMCKWRK